MKQKWIVPVAVGMLTLSLFGCSNTEMGAGRATTPDADKVHQRTTYHRSGQQMANDAHYYATDDGGVTGWDGTQKGCKDCPVRDTITDDIDRMGDDVERTLRNAGRTLDDMRTDM